MNIDPHYGPCILGRPYLLEGLGPRYGGHYLILPKPILKANYTIFLKEKVSWALFKEGPGKNLKSGI